MNKSDTKERIQDEVLRRLVKCDIGSIKVKEVTNALHISRQTFYLHYDSIYSVLQQIQEDCLQDLHKAFTLNSQYAFSDQYFYYPNHALLESIKFVRQNQTKYASLFGRYGDPMFQIGCEKFANQFIIERAISEKYIVIDDELKKMVYGYMIAGYNSIIACLLADDNQASDEKLSILIYRMLFGPFRSNFPQ